MNVCTGMPRFNSAPLVPEAFKPRACVLRQDGGQDLVLVLGQTDFGGIWLSALLQAETAA